MRWSIGLAVALLALSGCAESQTRISLDDGQSESHEHCWFFCDGHETHVHFDFFPLLLFVGLLALIIGVVAAVAGAGSRDSGQQQQQVVVVQERRQ